MLTFSLLTFLASNLNHVPPRSLDFIHLKLANQNPGGEGGFSSNFAPRDI